MEDDDDDRSVEQVTIPELKAIYADRAIKTVLDHLGLVNGGDRQVAASTLSNARYRLGAEPLRWLFERVARAWQDTEGLGDYADLALFGVDGTHLRVPDSDENFEHFGKPGGRSGSEDAGYPQLRMVALMNLSNRILAAARTGPFSESEQTLVKELWAEIPNNSLTLADRGFVSYMSLLELIAGGENRHFLFRLKNDTSYEVVRELSDGSVIALLHPPEYLLKKDPDLPGPIEVRVIAYQHEGGELSWLATTLTNEVAHPAAVLVALYHDRWELEIGFDEIKTHMLERKEALRSRKPEGVYQELWGQLLVYNLVRREMLLVARQHKLPPARVSFRASLLWIRDFWTTAWMIAPGNVPRSLSDLSHTLRDLILPERRSQRRNPRHVKIKMSNYPRNRGRRGRRKRTPPVPRSPACEPARRPVLKRTVLALGPPWEWFGRIKLRRLHSLPIGSGLTRKTARLVLHRGGSPNPTRPRRHESRGPRAEESRDARPKWLDQPLRPRISVRICSCAARGSVSSAGIMIDSSRSRWRANTSLSLAEFSASAARCSPSSSGAAATAAQRGSRRARISSASRCSASIVASVSSTARGAPRLRSLGAIDLSSSSACRGRASWKYRCTRAAASRT